MPTAAAVPIRRVYVEKRSGFDIEARRLRDELSEFIGAQFPAVAALSSVRILHRYDVAYLDADQIERAARLVFAEPQCDSLHIGTTVPNAIDGDTVFAIEYLPGQYDQRADSAEQCAELAVGVKPLVRTARVFVLHPASGSASGSASNPAADAPLSASDVEAIKRYLINPVDSREASLALPETLEPPVAEPSPVARLNGFRSASDMVLDALAREYGLAMASADLRFCRDYFVSIGRDPSMAELRVLDTYWSDHCRHSTFTTILEKIEVAAGPDAAAVKRALELYERARIEAYGKDGAAKRPRTLMDAATIGAKVLRKRGLVDDLEVSEEINACSVRVTAEFHDGSKEPWLLMFKNETHNHPTEIEPFGGAATCLGGAIRDPLSGRAYVHQAMRVSGGADPRVPLSATLPGKLPQLKIVREAAAGYASYGNQIGLATGQVSEFYHDGFMAKRMELGAVIGAVPEAWVRREEPLPGDVILLVGGKTGRDGIGGATGSSKAHTDESVRTAGAEVQKGNAVEERKIQRLFRNPETTRLIKRCNDFGAGGVSVAVGELARGLDIDLDAVPKKYEGIDGTELAISESQERMAVVVEDKDVDRFIALAAAENLTAVVVARVVADDRLRMSWKGDAIVELDRVFLDSNGASRSTAVRMAPPSASATSSNSAATGDVAQTAEGSEPVAVPASVLLDHLERELRSLRTGSRRGLQERFDGSIGAASVLFPWGGAEQGTPECGMAAALPSLGKDSRTASLMTFGYNPELASESPYRAAKAAVLESLAKIACLGGDPFAARLSLQEYFERTSNPEAWGKPLQALLGALEAQLELGVPAIGGKDSMSGSYRDPVAGVELTVPPTLVAFAAGVAPVAAVRSGALSGKSGAAIVLFALPSAAPLNGERDPAFAAFRANVTALEALTAAGLVAAAY
ncbi:MAG: phosphoribosylformylglycinamidine synthase, partial [Treponemataceae bacterium]